jgi:hypothetical protein
VGNINDSRHEIGLLLAIRETIHIVMLPEQLHAQPGPLLHAGYLSVGLHGRVLRDSRVANDGYVLPVSEYRHASAVGQTRLPCLCVLHSLTMIVDDKCRDQWDFECISTSSSYAYPWGPTLRCHSVYEVDFETSFITIDGTVTEGQVTTHGDPTTVKAPGTILAYGIQIKYAASDSLTVASAPTTSTASTGSETSSTLATATATTSTNPSASATAATGLSTGAAIGIGVAVGIGAIAILAAAGYLFLSRRRKPQPPGGYTDIVQVTPNNEYQTPPDNEYQVATENEYQTAPGSEYQGAPSNEYAAQATQKSQQPYYQPPVEMMAPEHIAELGHSK